MAAGVAKECLVQLAYAIGVAAPVSVFVDTSASSDFDDALIAQKVREMFDLRPAAIIEKFALKNPIYEPCAAYGHMGRTPYVKDGMQFFGWEKLDSVELVRSTFGI